MSHHVLPLCLRIAWNGILTYMISNTKTHLVQKGPESAPINYSGCKMDWIVFRSKPKTRASWGMVVFLVR
jgi:hypothetical protein